MPISCSPTRPTTSTRGRGLLTAVRAPFVVAEAGRPLESLDGLAEAGWEATRSKRYGRTWVTFFERIDR